MILTTITCFGPQVAIVRLCTLKYILSTMCEISTFNYLYLHIVLRIYFRVHNLMMAT